MKNIGDKINPINILKKVNIFSKGDKKESKQSQKKNLFDLAKDQEYQKLRTVKFGNMMLSQNMLFMEKRFVNCILPPNPILPGRKL